MEMVVSTEGLVAVTAAVGVAAVGLTVCALVVVATAGAAVGVWRVDAAVAATSRAAAWTGTGGAPVPGCRTGAAAVVAIGAGEVAGAETVEAVRMAAVDVDEVGAADAVFVAFATAGAVKVPVAIGSAAVGLTALTGGEGWSIDVAGGRGRAAGTWLATGVSAVFVVGASAVLLSPVPFCALPFGVWLAGCLLDFPAGAASTVLSALSWML